MAIYAGKFTYNDYDIMFWKTPKTIKATIWHPNSLDLVKRFGVRSGDGDFTKLKIRVMNYLNKNDKNGNITRISAIPTERTMARKAS